MFPWCFGMSLDDEYGGYYIGNNGSHVPMDQEFLMGQNIYLHGDMGDKHEKDPWDDGPSFDGSNDFGPDT